MVDKLSGPALSSATGAGEGSSAGAETHPDPVPVSAPGPVIVMADEVADSAAEKLRQDMGAEIHRVAGADRAGVLRMIQKTEPVALLVRSATAVDAELLHAAPRLRVVGRAGVGVDNIDVPACTARGIAVVNTPLANSHSAAEHTIGLLLAVARNLAVADSSLRAGQWRRSSLTGVEIYSKTVGIIGFGTIGRLVARRLQAFDARVIANDPYIDPGIAAQAGVELVSKEELMTTADVVTLHVPKTPETTGMIDARLIALAKPGQILVNAARGGLIDDAALAESIRASNGPHRGAGVDVWDNEPDVCSPLLELPQVVATPHLGAATVEAQERVGREVAGYIADVLRGERVAAAVNAAELYR